MNSSAKPGSIFWLTNDLIVEVKAVDQLAPIHKAQVISYLRATTLQLGLLLNFNVPQMLQGMKRIVLSHPL